MGLYLKKGSPNQLNNYRPVSCLPAASKILEIVICSQLSDYLESNKLLPSNQHGFRPRRSTMTAWQEIQLDWAMKTEKDLIKVERLKINKTFIHSFIHSYWNRSDTILQGQ